ncbi:MAG: GNAT family N-acetyltransferase [Merismopedia sp. SIO2A8]|nr:GNAT family N-acetyltransferase [Merismopedia sp. SIO2A8]
MSSTVMEFIPATAQHYGAIAQLVTSPEELYLVCPTCHYPWTVPQIEAIAQKRYNLTVGLLEGEVVAFSNLYDVQPDISAFIGNVIVSHTVRGKGIGKALLQHMMHLCQTEHQAQPHLSVVNHNTPALLLYTRLGFKPYSVEERPYLNGGIVGLIHMQYAKT